MFVKSKLNSMLGQGLIAVLVMLLTFPFGMNRLHAQGAGGSQSGLPPQDLEKLVGPIALYPDDLVGIVLPASTNALQIASALTPTTAASAASAPASTASAPASTTSAPSATTGTAVRTAGAACPRATAALVTTCHAVSAGARGLRTSASLLPPSFSSLPCPGACAATAARPAGSTWALRRAAPGAGGSSLLGTLAGLPLLGSCATPAARTAGSAPDICRPIAPTDIHASIDIDAAAAPTGPITDR